MKLFYYMKSKSYNLFIMKSVSITRTNANVEHYMDGLLAGNKQKT